MSVLYKVYDGLGNLVVSTADFGLALDVGLACDLRDGAPRLVMEHLVKPAGTLPSEAVYQPSRRFSLGSFSRRKKA